MSGYSVSINDFTSNVSVEPFSLSQMELLFSETVPWMVLRPERPEDELIHDLENGSKAVAAL